MSVSISLSPEIRPAAVEDVVAGEDSVEEDLAVEGLVVIEEDVVEDEVEDEEALATEDVVEDVGVAVVHPGPGRVELLPLRARKPPSKTKVSHKTPPEILGWPLHRRIVPTNSTLLTRHIL
jgi:hypothetical protein